MDKLIQQIVDRLDVEQLLRHGRLADDFVDETAIRDRVKTILKEELKFCMNMRQPYHDVDEFYKEESE